MAKRLMNNDVHIFTQVFRINHLMLTIHNSGPFNSEISVQNYHIINFNILVSKKIFVCSFLLFFK